MNRPAGTKPEPPARPPKPLVRKIRWPLPVIWLVPLFAAGVVGYYLYDHFENRGPRITIRFTDATGIKAGQTQVVHLGVQIGQVTQVDLSPDQKQAMVQVRLLRSHSMFAARGSLFWIVRPEISAQEISGLATVLSGPVIDARPGAGEPQTEFTGLPKPPIAQREGLKIVLTTPNLERLQPDSPIYYRGIQVGLVQEILLSPDATRATLHALIHPRYSSLVKANSEFWAVSPVDLKGGLFSGIQIKMESLRSLLSGGIAFATPQEDMGKQAQDGATFDLHDEPKKDWLTWAPKISIDPADENQAETNPKLPTPPRATGAHVESD